MTSSFFLSAECIGFLPSNKDLFSLNLLNGKYFHYFFIKKRIFSVLVQIIS